MFSRIDSDLNLNIPFPAHLRVLANQVLAGVETSRGSPPATPMEKDALIRWGQWLPLEDWGRYLLAWSRALQAYGTPLDFIDQLKIRETQLTLLGDQYRFSAITNPCFEERKKLTASNKPYAPAFSLDHYPEKINPSCVLCTNVFQVEDASIKNLAELNCSIISSEEYLFVPNRYPRYPGHSMLILKQHDQPRDTAARIMSASDFRAAIWLASIFKLIWFRNHTQLGMSLPGHDHIHLEPADLRSLRIVKSYWAEALDKKQTFFEPQSTPFAILGIYHSEREELIKLATQAVEKLERYGLVYHLCGYKNLILICPYRIKPDEKRPVFPGVLPIAHELDVDEELALERIKQYIPLKGEFDWLPLIQS